MIVLNSTYAFSNSKYPRLLADADDIAKAKLWIKKYPWHRQIFKVHKAEIDHYEYRCPVDTSKDRKKIKEKLFYPLVRITQQFPESASNGQLWYNNVSAAVGFLYRDQELIDFALKGNYGFEWQLGSALP